MKRILGIVLALAIMLAGVQPAYANQQAEPIVPVVAESSLQMLGSMNPAVTTITVNKADAKTAKKIHDQLMKRKSVKLKVKGSRKTAEENLKKLQKQMGPVNQMGVQFQYDYSDQANGYADFLISKEDAKCYYYAVKFMKKLYKNMRSYIKVLIDKYKEADELEKRYPDERARKLALAYNYFGESFISAGFDVYGFEKQNIEGIYALGERDVQTAWNYVNTHLVKEGDGNVVFIKSFDEFLQTDGVDLLVQYAREVDLEYYVDNDIDKQLLMIYEKPFYKLSDAMKVYAISYSGYFASQVYKTGGLTMYYDYENPASDRGASALKKMYENKASGICHTFALYEVTLFRSLGIECYYNSSVALDHAWSVVKVKNSKGKTLWVPFDYGIGPSAYLYPGISEEVLYGWYLGGIKGAPSTRNYTMDDFN